MDTLPLAPRPSLEQYRRRARELVAARHSADPEAVRAWAQDWLESLARHLDIGITPFVLASIDRAVRHIEQRVREQRGSGEAASFALADAQLLIAQAHGFERWAGFARHLEHLTGTRPDGDDFESAADAVVSGDLVTLESLMLRQPDLVRARSARVHRATLLHYVAANGVEDFRQTTPPNAVDVARLLLDAGADVDALAETYGGGADQTTMNLLVSSVHPAAAGRQAELVETLLEFGAAVDGVSGDCSPLMTAIAFAYPGAANALARGGATIDNVIAAAALGRLDLVQRFVVDAHTLARGVALVAPRWYGLPNDPTTHIERAFIAACKFGRADVVALLSSRGVNHAASDSMTGLHWAAGHRYMQVVTLLLERGAPLEVKNEWGGTVLDSTVWFARHPPVDHPHEGPDVGYLTILETLIAAGANVDAVAPFPTGNEEIDRLLRGRGRA